MTIKQGEKTKRINGAIFTQAQTGLPRHNPMCLFLSEAVLLHRNKLSCELPSRSSGSKSRMALVAIGNHFAYPGNKDFPPWVLPFERDGLFWVNGTVARCLVSEIAAFLKRLRVRIGLHLHSKMRPSKTFSSGRRAQKRFSLKALTVSCDVEA